MKSNKCQSYVICTISRLTLILCAFCSFASSIRADEPLKTPGDIQRIIDELPCNIPYQGTFTCPLITSEPLYTESSYGIVTHIGVKLFSNDLKDATDRAVCQCIERILLEMLTKNTVEKQKSVLKSNGMKMTFNGFPFGSNQFGPLNTAIASIKASDNISMEADRQIIAMNIGTAHDDLIRIVLPADRSLIVGTDKAEAEQQLRLKLVNESFVFQPNDIQDLPVHLTTDGLYVFDDNCYMIDSLRSGAYYYKQGDDYLPVYSAQDPVHSIQNLLLGVAPSEWLDATFMTIRLRSYMPNGKDINVKLTSLLGCMQAEGMIAYCANYQHSKTRSPKSLLVFYHPLYQYIHMLVVNHPSKDELMSDKNLQLRATMYAFIPQNNIKDIFN